MSILQITQENYDAEVRNSPVPVLLDFWAPWCGPCRMAMPLIEEIAKERTDIRVGKINVDEEPKLAEDFGIMSIPTIVVVKDGQVAGQAVGMRSKAQILNLLG
ncbi:MAG: thioredoxin [Oscillospiraceae bacterium]|nr:thioredoxin [Oscillospiraceae bacterium]